MEAEPASRAGRESALPVGNSWCLQESYLARPGTDFLSDGSSCVLLCTVSRFVTGTAVVWRSCRARPPGDCIEAV